MSLKRFSQDFDTVKTAGVLYYTFCMAVEFPGWHAVRARTAKARHTLK